MSRRGAKKGGNVATETEEAAEAAGNVASEPVGEAASSEPDAVEEASPEEAVAETPAAASKRAILAAEVLTIRTRRVTRHYAAGLTWTTEPVEVATSELSEEQLRALASEPLLHITVGR